MKQVICQKCGEKAASVFYRENKNGKETELCLCPDCARALGVGAFHEEFFSPFSLFSPKTQIRSEEKCPLCGTTLAKIRRDGKFGCSTCYDTFSDRLDLSPFIGKGYDAIPPSAPEQAPAPEQAKEEKPSELDALKAELKKAVAAEDYERAAVLRDKIRAKEGK